MTDETQAEPGFGRYRDRDFGIAGRAANRGFWEHAEEGWRYFSHEDDAEPGEWMSWTEAKRYAPFTPIEDVQLTSEAAHESEKRRGKALSLAVQHHASRNFKGGDIIEIAGLFEAYLKGGE